MATDRANYTPEELHKAKAVLAALPYRTVLAGDAARAVLDAVLPGYTQRIQAEALGDAVDVIEDSDDKTEALERVQMLRQDVARAAALATPTESGPAREPDAPTAVSDAQVNGWVAPPDEIIETDRWGL